MAAFTPLLEKMMTIQTDEDEDEIWLDFDLTTPNGLEICGMILTLDAGRYVFSLLMESNEGDRPDPVAQDELKSTLTRFTVAEIPSLETVLLASQRIDHPQRCVTCFSELST